MHVRAGARSRRCRATSMPLTRSPAAPARARASPICPSAEHQSPRISSARRCGSWLPHARALLALVDEEAAVQGQHRPQRGLGHRRVRSPDRPCARSARPAGTVGSASSRSTPAHSDWIRRRRGSACQASRRRVGDDRHARSPRAVERSPSRRQAWCGAAAPQRLPPLRRARRRRNGRPAAPSCGSCLHAARTAPAARASAMLHRARAAPRARSPSQLQRARRCVAAPRCAASRARPVPTGLPGVAAARPGDAGDRHRESARASARSAPRPSRAPPPR